MGKRLLPTDSRRLFVITPDGEFEELFGKKADKNRKLDVYKRQQQGLYS